MSTTDHPTAVRQIDTPAGHALADLASILDDLRSVLHCCERLVTELARPSQEIDDVVVEAVWTTALLSYARCFDGGRRGMGLTEEDVAGTSLQGEVVQWHQVLLRLRERYADPAANPREQFSVGATQGSDGRATGIALTSSGGPTLDDVTVRQTGALAYELSRLVDGRITEHQARVLEAVNDMSKDDLDRLPLIEVSLGGTPG